MTEREKRHDQRIREYGGEYTVLLKKDGRFPLERPGKIALYGSGAEFTVFGGTGSGESVSRNYKNVRQGLEEDGFTVTTSYWLKRYADVRKKEEEDFRNAIRQEAKETHQMALLLAMGRAMPEPEYEFDIDGDGDTAIYVLARNSGEGSDRNDVPGDIRLSETEIRDIRTCSEKYENFMLVLNIGGVIDLTPVKDVQNILILSQLGTQTGTILADILLGRSVPSGKLTTTWAPYKKYCHRGDFEETNDSRYREGVFVGYRYFDSFDVEPLYPFGYGLSYTEFEIGKTEVSVQGKQADVKISVKNTGEYKGKEIVQVYVSKPQGKDVPVKELIAYAKTKELLPGEEEELDVCIDLRELESYDEGSSAMKVHAGDHILYVGKNSKDADAAAVFHLGKDVLTGICKRLFERPNIVEIEREKWDREVPEGLPCFELNERNFSIRELYTPDETVEDTVRNMSDEELCLMELGTFNKGNILITMIGSSSATVAGAAGETCREFRNKGIESLVMADGPAGIRISNHFFRNEEGAHSMEPALLPTMQPFLPKPLKVLMKALKKRPKKEDPVYEVYPSSIPIATAIAQSWNEEVAGVCGDVVGEDMEEYNIDLWLAPGMNIHRDIRCGRNFEYYSEDPYLSGKTAAAIIRGVQAHKGKGCTPKHFTANNQEYNRMYANAVVTERTMREIYLKGFRICIEESDPKALMTSYNLLNGLHTAEFRTLIEGYLRRECGFKGLVMTDWIISAMGSAPGSDYRCPVPEEVAKAGGDLFMPGGIGDYKRLLNAVKNDASLRGQMEKNVSRTLRMIKELKG